MSRWKDVGERRRMCTAVDDLVKTAEALDDPSAGFLRQARVYVGDRNPNTAHNAVGDLSYAADQCDDSDLKRRIEGVEQELRELLFP